MSGISGISGSGYSDYGSFASGKRINTAADGASELAIAEKEDTQVTGYNVGTQNMQQGQSMLNIADSALASVTDSLQRIRELSLQASSSALMTDSDIQSIQDEIDQIKQGITDIADQTSYNTKNLLNGSESEFQLATNANGDSATLATGVSTLEALGIADYDVTGDFDLSAIDDALAKVSEQRSSIGAQSNGLDYAMNANTSAAYYHTRTVSQMEDLDYPAAVEEKKRQEALQAYSLIMQRKKQEEEANRINHLIR